MIKKCFFVLLCFTAMIYALDIRVATEEWKNATNADGTGLYWDILREVYSADSLKIIPVIESYDDTVELLEQEEVDILIGAYKNEIENCYYPNFHFGIDVVQVVFKKDSNLKWQGDNSLINKRVAWIKDYGYEFYMKEDIRKQIKIFEVMSREELFNLLVEDKTDYIIDARVDIIFFLNDNKDYDSSDFDKKNFEIMNLYFVFAKNEKGKRLKDVFDQRFPILLKEKIIRKVYNKTNYKLFVYPHDFP